MVDGKGINIPASISINGVDWNITEDDLQLRKYQFPKRSTPSENRRDSEFLRAYSSKFNAIRALIHLTDTQESAKSKYELNKQKQDYLLEVISTRLGARLQELTALRESKDIDFANKQWLARFKSEEAELKHARDVEILKIKRTDKELFEDVRHNNKMIEEEWKTKHAIEIINARANASKEVTDNKYQNMRDLMYDRERLRKQRELDKFNSQFGMEGLYGRLRNGLAKIGLPLDDLRHLWLARTGKASILPKRMDAIRGNLKAFGIGTAITAGVSAVTFLTKKTFSTLLSTSKKIVSVFTDAAKQAETFKTIMNLALAPIITMFTLLFVPMLIAMVPLIKTMFDWVLSNKEAIMAVGNKFGTIFNADNLNIVGKALDGILFVLDALANIFSTNASMIDTSSLTRFISSTVLVITNMIQDIMMSIIAFCYSPEGQAFIKSVAYSVGEIIGSIFTTVVALLPVIAESIFYSIIGFISGIGSMISKAIFNLFDVIDNFTGGAISGFLNTIVNLINTAINALNSINIFGFNPFNIPTLNGGSVGQIGSSVNNFADQSIVNNFNVNNMMSISSPSVLKDVMSTGVY